MNSAPIAPRPWWRRVLDRIWSTEGLAIALVSTTVLIVGGLLKFFLLDLPARKETARINDVVERLTTAQATEVEQRLKPVITLKPTCTQSDSVEDIREIRMRVVIENVGGAGAELLQLELDVAEGKPKEDAQQDLRITREFYQKRFQIADPVTAPPKPEPLTKRNDNYIDTPTDATHPCRHGRIFAISNTSQHLFWTELQHACDTIGIETVLRPKQSVQHEFVFVLTEFPEQHHRQWLRFNIKAYWRDESDPRPTILNMSSLKSAETEMIVPGLPLVASTIHEVGASNMMPAMPTKGQVWRAEVPTISPRAPLFPNLKRDRTN